MQITNEQIIALIAALVPIIVSLSAYLYKVLVGKLPPQKQAILQQVATQAVQMAEQVVGPGNGAAKRAMAEEAINAGLKSLGVNVAPSLVNAAIESLVFALNQQQVTHPVLQPVTATHG
jgi:LL-H family phage holin